MPELSQNHQPWEANETGGFRNRLVIRATDYSSSILHFVYILIIIAAKERVSFYTSLPQVQTFPDSLPTASMLPWWLIGHPFGI